MMKELSHNRNGTEVFAHRTQKNLEYIATSAINGEDVHPVTQAILALLGIVVFPWEKSAFDIVKKRKLPLLSANGWPKWKMSGTRRVINLEELIKVLRHSVAHGNIEFDSDSRNPADVTISFTNI
ncbi:MAG: HEPN family nuclease, partial [Acidobacteriota bacterium]